MLKDIQRSVAVLHDGGLVAFPTETVYGLGADARNENAIRKVFTTKGRPLAHPLIVHIASIEQLDNWAVNIPAAAKLLAKCFWPGPLTLVLPKHPLVSNLITGGQNTIAIRIPKHPLTLAMLQQFGGGIVGPSANTYGRLSPTSAEHVRNNLGNRVDYILDGGACEIGIESTIVHITDNEFNILRQGDITADDIFQVLGSKFVNIATKEKPAIRVPGTAKAHYAPIKPLFLVQPEELLPIAKFMFTKKMNYSYLCFQQCPIELLNTNWCQAPEQAFLYAKNLYAVLHKLDAEDIQGIIIEKPPQQLPWLAITDRLTRASNGTLTLEMVMNKALF